MERWLADAQRFSYPRLLWLAEKINDWQECLPCTLKKSIFIAFYALLLFTNEPA
jgi:membrane protein insertase Oxa1/YidC/SpoIIIJ